MSSEDDTPLARPSSSFPPSAVLTFRWTPLRSFKVKVIDIGSHDSVLEPKSQVPSLALPIPAGLACPWQGNPHELASTTPRFLSVGRESVLVEVLSLP